MENYKEELSMRDFYRSVLIYLQQQQQQAEAEESGSPPTMEHFFQQHQDVNYNYYIDTTTTTQSSSWWSWTVSSMVDVLPYCNITAILLLQTSSSSSSLSRVNSSSNNNNKGDDNDSITTHWLTHHLPRIAPTRLINVTHYADTLFQSIMHHDDLIRIQPPPPPPQWWLSLRHTIHQQVWLQLLEQYVTMTFPEYCHYAPYIDDTAGRIRLRGPEEPRSNTHGSDSSVTEHSNSASSSSPFHIMYIVSTHHDLAHLQSLLDAIVPSDHGTTTTTTTIILHIDPFTTMEYRHDLENLLASSRRRYPSHSVHLYLFESEDGIIYRTDSLSLVNFKLLYYIAHHWSIPYDYVVLCDGLSYPLVSAQEFRRVLTSSRRQVYLGQLLHNGQRVEQQEGASSLFIHRLYTKRLILALQIQVTTTNSSTTVNTTTTTIPFKLHLRLPRNLYPVPQSPSEQQADPIYQSYHTHTNFKSTSGNQGIYSAKVIRRLVTSPKVQELFVRSKYTCCCCMEEHNWIAALHIIDRDDTNEQNDGGDDTDLNDTHSKSQDSRNTLDVATNTLDVGASHGIFYDAYHRPTSVFQLWGGVSTKCQGTMSNAILSLSPSSSKLCYRSEDPYHSLYTTDRNDNVSYSNASTTTLSSSSSSSSNPTNYFMGDDLWNVLVHARHHRQAIMARKLTSLSNDTDSYQQLIQMIQTKLWNTNA